MIEPIAVLANEQPIQMLERAITDFFESLNLDKEHPAYALVCNVNEERFNQNKEDLFNNKHIQFISIPATLSDSERTVCVCLNLKKGTTIRREDILTLDSINFMQPPVNTGAHIQITYTLEALTEARDWFDHYCKTLLMPPMSAIATLEEVKKYRGKFIKQLMNLNPSCASSVHRAQVTILAS